MPGLETVNIDTLPTDSALAKLLGVRANGTSGGRTLAGLGADLAGDATAMESMGAGLTVRNAGVGAAAKTAQAWKRYTISPMDYGAVGDGATNDTAAMLATITDAIARGIAIDLHGRTYLLETWTELAVTGALMIHGQGGALKGPSSTVHFLRPGSKLVVHDIVFDRWAAVLNRPLADAVTITKLRVTDCELKNCTSICINIETTVNDYKIEDNIFDSNSGGMAIRIGENTYANQDLRQRGRITRNTIRALSGTGSTPVCGILVYGAYNKINENLVYDLDSDSGEVWGIYTKSRHTKVVGNTIYDLKTSSGTELVGINIKGNVRASTAAPQGYDVIADENHVLDIGVLGVKGAGMRMQTDDVQAVNNHLEDTGAAGIVADEATGMINVDVSHNTIRFSAASGTVGITDSSGGNNHKICHNTIFGANAGILYGAGSVVGTNYDISHNILDAVTAALSYSSVQDITGVNIADNQLVAGARGWLNNEAGGGHLRARFKNNDFGVATSGQYQGAIQAGSTIELEVRKQTTTADLLIATFVTLADDVAMLIEASCVAKKTDGTARAKYARQGMMYRDGGGATIDGAIQTIGTDIESTAGWNFVIGVDTNSPYIGLVGEAATVIDWAVTARMSVV